MHFDFQELTHRLERFSSSRLALRPLCLADAWPLFRATRHEHFNENLAWDQPTDIDGVVQRLELICKAANRGELTALAAVARDTGEWVSLFRFFPPMNKEPGVLEMGIWTHVKFWTGHHSFDLGKLCVDTAFRVSNVKRLIGLAAPGNRGSIHLMRMVGMTERCRSFKYHETGRKLPTIQCEVSREEWEASRPEVSSFHEFNRARKAMPTRSLGARVAEVSELVEASAAVVAVNALDAQATVEDILLKRWTEASPTLMQVQGPSPAAGSATGTGTSLEAANAGKPMLL